MYTNAVLPLITFPGTEFDWLFFGVCATVELNALLARTHSDEVRRLAQVVQGWQRLTCWQSLGEEIARLIAAGDSAALHRMADALNKWKRHKPQPDLIRALLIAMDGLNKPQGTLPKEKNSVRDVVKELQRRGVSADNNTARVVRRYAKELGIELDHTPGRPRKNRTKAP